MRGRQTSTNRPFWPRIGGDATDLVYVPGQYGMAAWVVAAWGVAAWMVAAWVVAVWMVAAWVVTASVGRR